MKEEEEVDPMYSGAGLLQAQQQQQQQQQQQRTSSSLAVSVSPMLRRWSAWCNSSGGSGHRSKRTTIMVVGVVSSLVIITLQVILIALLTSRRTHVVSTATVDAGSGHARSAGNAHAIPMQTTSATPLIDASSSLSKLSEHTHPYLCSITRVRNEHVKFASFVRHQRREGFDVVYILDDRSDPPLTSHDPRVVIARVDFSDIAAQNARAGRTVVNPYGLDTVREHVQKKLTTCEWIAYVDVDEFLITRRNETATVREELARSFTHADAVHVPWVLFGNNLQQRGSSVMHSDIPLEVMWRFNHSRHHQGYDMKTRDRFWEIGTDTSKARTRDSYIYCASH